MGRCTINRVHKMGDYLLEVITNYLDWIEDYAQDYV